MNEEHTIISVTGVASKELRNLIDAFAETVNDVWPSALVSIRETVCLQRGKPKTAPRKSARTKKVTVKK